MNNNITIVLVLCTLILGISTMVITDNIQTTNLAIEATKAGLEQCPNRAGHRGGTIWKRNCNE